MLSLIVLNAYKSSCHTRLSHAAASELQDHMNVAAGFELVVLESMLVSHLLARENESNLVNLNTFLLFEMLLNLQHGVVGVEVECNLLA